MDNTHTQELISLDGESLTAEAVFRASRDSAFVAISPSSREKMAASRDMLEAWVKEGRIMYGITTGFGPFVSTLIPPSYQEELQKNLIRSHAANVGPYFSKEETRAAMLLRLNAFAKGYSAIRLETADLLLAFLNKGIHPRIPQWGSVGASGDLNPSAHIALSLMGEGEVEYGGNVMTAEAALSAAHLTPVVFRAKEGLALINGTTMMTGVGVLQIADAWALVRTAEILTALAIEALKGSREPFQSFAHLAKPHPGQIASAANVDDCLDGSALAWDKEKLSAIQQNLRTLMNEKNEVVDSGISVQAAYTLRATPQILGAVRDALTYVTERLTTEMNSANDNPLFFTDRSTMFQGAHFHGQSVSLPLDVLAISFVEIGNLAERQLNRLLDPARSNGLSPFLARGRAGLRCGLEGAQYIATSLLAECRALAAPVSIQSISSNGENQDVVSLGLVAARKARDIKEKISYILAVLLFALSEALEEQKAEELSPVAGAVLRHVRMSIRAYDSDRHMSPLLETAKAIVASGSIVTVAEKTLGKKLA
ncbi:MAG: tyrosine 2,3-aminomutase [Patescibacteria group bacterium]